MGWIHIDPVTLWAVPLSMTILFWIHDFKEAKLYEVQSRQNLLVIFLLVLFGIIFNFIFPVWGIFPMPGAAYGGGGGGGIVEDTIPDYLGAETDGSTGYRYAVKRYGPFVLIALLLFWLLYSFCSFLRRALQGRALQAFVRPATTTATAATTMVPAAAAAAALGGVQGYYYYPGPPGQNFPAYRPATVVQPPRPPPKPRPRKKKRWRKLQSDAHRPYCSSNRGFPATVLNRGGGRGGGGRGGGGGGAAAAAAAAVPVFYGHPQPPGPPGYVMVPVPAGTPVFLESPEAGDVNFPVDGGDEDLSPHCIKLR